MDQVKIYLRMLKKQHFWLLCALAALVGYICWWMGANSLAKETKTHEEKVKASYTALDKVSKEPRPPNGQFEEGVKAKNEELKKKVLDEWRVRYEQQQQLFTWPALVADRVASPLPDDPIFINEIVRQLCQNNEIFLNELRDKIYLTADYRRPKAQADADAPEADGDAPPKAGEPHVGLAADPAAPIEEEGLVVWSKSHQDLLEQRYSLGKLPSTPTSLDIRLAQEDMWVLENLAKVIRQTNEGAEDVIAVPIKRIDSLEVAQWAINDAVRESPKVYTEKSESSGSAGGMGGGGAGGAAGEAAPPETQADKDKLTDDQLLNGRYIGDTGLPLTASDSPSYAEFKLMFVRLKVVIDQRKIPDLLRNCGNAPIPIEVVRVTMHEPLVSAGTAAANNPAPGGLGGGLAGARPGAAPAAAGHQQNPGAAKADDIEANPSDVTVEVCGLVQLYNPPDKADETDDSKRTLGKGSAQDPGKRPAGVPSASVPEPRGGRGGGGGGGLLRKN